VTTVTVDLQPDHLERLIGRPLVGMVELLANAFDADANKVEVTLDHTELGAIDRITVTDDGHGMTYDEAIEAFGSLGGSQKRAQVQSRIYGRTLHGSQGKGRWAAYSLGDIVTWRSVTEGEGGHQLVEVRGSRGSLRNFIVSEPVATSQPTGTTVTIESVRQEAAEVESERFRERLGASFALYFEKYHVQLIVDGDQISSTAYIFEKAEYELDDGASLVVIEWNRQFDRALYLCDPDGMALEELHPGIHAPNFNFTAYVRWQRFRELHVQGLLAFAEQGIPEAAPVIEQAKETLRDHFQRRAEDERRTVIQQWKDDEVYPYAGAPLDEVEEVQRDLFDVVASAAASAVEDGDRQSKRLSLRLLREAVESNPSSLRRVLSEVLNLPAERLAELEELLERTTLTAIITATKRITDRLAFLAGLKELVFHAQSKKELLERRQLHRIVAEESWVFGERYALTANDESLTAVLKAHRKLLHDEHVIDDEPVRREDGSVGIIDLMLSRTVPQQENRLQHLIVELKRPSIKVGPDEITQIKSYAFAVAKDERFAGVDVSWEFWVVSNELTEYAKLEANQDGREPGVVHQSGNVCVWVKPWAELIQAAEYRLKFVQRALNYQPSTQQALTYLRQAHARYLPDALAAEPPPADQ
jgi:hypothetical protein